MTNDRLEAARAFVAAGDALASPEHTADVEQLREISLRVTEREEAFKAAQAALFEADCKAVETGAEPAADNTEAKAVIENETTVDVEKYFRPIFGAEEVNEFSSSRANGAYTED